MQALLVDGDYARDAVPERRGLFSSWPLAGETLHGDDELHPLHGGRAMSVDGARVVTLDALLHELGIGGEHSESVDFVKLDADGGEASILEGARDLLHHSRPEIALEMAPYVFSAGELERLLGILGEAKYRLADLGDRRTLPLDAEALRRRIPHGAGTNLLAMPAEHARRRPAGALHRGLAQRLLVSAYGWVARSGLLSLPPVEALFLRAYFLFKRHREGGELEHLRSLLPPGSTVIDVGANCGFFSAEIARSPAVARVLAVEPEAVNQRRLRKTLRRHALEGRVVPIHAAADATSGRVGLELNPLHHGDHKIAVSTGDAAEPERVEVESRTIDDLVAEYEVPLVGLIKIDVQGAELRVLAGAGETVRRGAPAVFLEMHEPGFGAKLEDLLEWAAEHNYVAFVLDSGGSGPVERRRVGDAAAVRRHVESGGEGYTDLLLLPREA